MVRELPQSQHSPTPTPSSSCLMKLTAARSSLGLLSSTQPILPSTAAQALDVCLGVGRWGLSGRPEGERERKARQKEIRMGKRNRWGKTEKGVQEWGPSAPACLGSRCQ